MMNRRLTDNLHQIKESYFKNGGLNLKHVPPTIDKAILMHSLYPGATMNSVERTPAKQNSGPYRVNIRL